MDNSNYSVTVAKTAGFCYGVRRAVERVYYAVAKGQKIATIGPLIHNAQVIGDLAAKGVYAYEKVADIPSDCVVVIRAHGVPQSVYKELEGREFIDLTCPFVSKIHKIVAQEYKNGRQIVIIGDKKHPEVIGINGHCNNSAYITYDENEHIDEKIMEKDVCIVAQTTIKKEIFVQKVHFLKKTCKSTLIFDTICSATRDRQDEADKLSKDSDMMIVIGGRESSNTRKLYEISKKNCDLTYHVETSEELPHKNNKIKKVGITAGASTPHSIIEEVVKAYE